MVITRMPGVPPTHAAQASKTTAPELDSLPV
jgi:hypothetical protein